MYDIAHGMNNRRTDSYDSYQLAEKFEVHWLHVAFLNCGGLDLDSKNIRPVQHRLMNKDV